MYTADQTSNTVSVIDPSSDTLLGTIPLGEPRLDGVLGPQYIKEADVHGLGFSRDGRYIDVIDVTTNAVVVIETATNHIVSKTYVGRAPHEGFFTPDGTQVWVAVRGESYVAVIDPIAGKVLQQIPTADGPSKVVFSPDGQYAYVNHIRSATIDVISVKDRTVVHSIAGLPSAFSSDEAISPDGRELWAAHKTTGQTSVIDAKTFALVGVVETGLRTNHPNFVTTPTAAYAYVSVGGLNETQVYRRNGGAPQLVKRIKDTAFEPHGLWPSPDNTRMYVVQQFSDKVDVIDTASMAVIDTIANGQDSQALVYVANAVPTGSGTANLTNQGLNQRVATMPALLQGIAAGSAEGAVRALKGADMVEVAAAGLLPNSGYTVSGNHNGELIPLFTFTTDEKGAEPEAIAFLKFFGVYADQVVISPGAMASANAKVLRVTKEHGD